jgi:tetratricopeptide (TPR) repeat protein/GT2 family glycosyltransferase
MLTIAENIKKAIQYHQSGHLCQAEQLYQKILQNDPDNPVALHSLGIIAHQREENDLAVELISKAITNNPQIPHFHNTLGLVFEAQGEFAKAISAYQEAVFIKPDYAEAYHNMAIALQSLGRYAASVEKCKHALSLKPYYAEAYNTMGFSLEKQEQYAEAIENYRQAVRFKPDFAEAYNHLGVVLNLLEHPDEALDNYKKALQYDPDYIEVHWNLSLAFLRTGRLIEGWKEYEWRLNPELGMTTYPHHFETPRWDGSFFTSQRLLVHYEQGLGDTLHFMRYLSIVKARGGTVILEVRKPLYGLLQNFPGVDELIEASFDNRPAVNFDYHISLMDLPKIFATTLETIPADVPYIHACTIKVEHWKNKLASPDFKVGIVWAGSSEHDKDRYRSCALKFFEPLTKIDGLRLYSLQKGKAAAQIDELGGTITDIANEFQDFADTAAAIENLDLVISVDTSVLHLAGAMGKPVWAVLPFSPDWRWMLNRQDSPWYPTMKLFRQKKWGQWEPVFQRVADELRIAVAKYKTKSHCFNFRQKQLIPAIIPYYKNKNQLDNCTAHLKKQTVEVETFIRDNSNDNIYFTAALNEGIKKYLNQPCEYILVLNQDMYLEPIAVERMVTFMDSHPECGIGAPLQMHVKIPNYVIFAGSYEAFPAGKHQHGQLSEFTENKPILWCNGACMILRKEMIQEIGLMDKNFVLLGSDSDYCFTARSRGWQVWRIAGAKGIHEHGVSGISSGSEIEIQKLKDMIYFGKKWLTGKLYKEMAYEGEYYTPEIIDDIMNKLINAKCELESYDYTQIH